MFRTNVLLFRAMSGFSTNPWAFNNTPGFTVHAATRVAHDLCLEAAKGTAIVGCKILSDKNMAQRV